MNISLIGCGWFGKALAVELLTQGVLVKGTTRSKENKLILEQLGIKTFLLTPEMSPPSELLTSDVIVLNIPPFPDQDSWFKSWIWNFKKKIIFISSTSIYGEVSGSISEDISPLPSTKNGEILLSEENWIRENFENWTILRFGGLLGDKRHPGKYLSGKKELSGKNWPVNLLHLEDAVHFTKTVIDIDIKSEIFNVVSDEHSTREEFYTDYCIKAKIPMPEFKEDFSLGKLIQNEKLKTIYKLRKPILRGKIL